MNRTLKLCLGAACFLPYAWLSRGCDDFSAAAESPTAFYVLPDGTELADGGIIPYRNGGQFVVGVRLHVPQLQQSTHALIEIVEPAPLPSAVVSATATLTDQGNQLFSGSSQLTWPLGGPVHIRVSALGQLLDAMAPLSLPELHLDLGPLTNTGTSQTGVICLGSTTPDGNVTLRLEKATISGAGTTEATTALLPGDCPVASSLTGIASHATWTIVPQGSQFLAIALLQSTNVVYEHEFAIAQRVPVTLTVTSPSGLTPAPLSIVTVQVQAMFDAAPAGGVSVQLLGTADVVLVPALVNTDKDGQATASFTMPADGAVHVEALVGSVTAGIDFQ